MKIMLVKKEVAEINECPDCASLNIVHNVEREQVVCKDCGLIAQPTTQTEITPQTIKKKTGRAGKKTRKNRR